MSNLAIISAFLLISCIVLTISLMVIITIDRAFKLHLKARHRSYYKITLVKNDKIDKVDLE